MRASAAAARPGNGPTGSVRCSSRTLEPVATAGLVIVVATALVGLLATIAWWERADQTS
jgi:hypothetical protein